MAERYWALVVKNDEGCWGWSGCVAGNGYPILIDEAGKQVHCHRVGYELQVGPIPPGMMVLHRCDNPICSRGDHLWLGTHADNMRDMVSKRRSLAGERHPNSVLTEACVREMRDLYGYGLSVADLADRFGVSKYTVIDVCQRRRSWQHVT